jgi:hypothetical protein
VMSAGVRERLCLPAAGSGASSALSVVATASGRLEMRAARKAPASMICRGGGCRVAHNF